MYYIYLFLVLCLLCTLCRSFAISLYLVYNDNKMIFFFKINSKAAADSDADLTCILFSHNSLYIFWHTSGLKVSTNEWSSWIYEHCIFHRIHTRTFTIKGPQLICLQLNFTIKSPTATAIIVMKTVSKTSQLFSLHRLYPSQTCFHSWNIGNTLVSEPVFTYSITSCLLVWILLAYSTVYWYL